MTSSPEKRLRIVVLWGATLSDGYLTDLLLGNPKYDFELVSWDPASPQAASWGRLWNLRRRLARGEFALVISGPVQSSADRCRVSCLLSGLLRGKVPLAVIDFLDTSYVLPNDFPLLKAATLYFKLNLYFWPRRSLMPLETFFSMRRVTAFTPKLRPLTHGVAPRAIPEKARPMRERDIDLCFVGAPISARSKDESPDLTRNSIRRELHERCLKLKERHNVFCFDGGMPREEYLELLQRSRLMVCTESFGGETFRPYEAAAAGVVPLMNWPHVQTYLPLLPDVHAIYFSLIGDDFERTVARALGHPEKLEEIAQKTRTFILQHKRCRDVGERVIEETLREHAKAGASSA